VAADSNSEMMTDSVPMTLIFWIQNQQASTQCPGILLCQVPSHSSQRFSFYHANIHTHAHTPWQWSQHSCRQILTLDPGQSGEPAPEMLTIHTQKKLSFHPLITVTALQQW